MSFLVVKPQLNTNIKQKEYKVFYRNNHDTFRVIIKETLEKSRVSENQRPIRSETLSPCFPWISCNALCFFPFINLTIRSLNGQIYKPVNSRMRLHYTRSLVQIKLNKSKTKALPKKCFYFVFTGRNDTPCIFSNMFSTNWNLSV